ncbi:MAG: ATP-binding protein [Anaerolineae bacterium]
MLRRFIGQLLEIIQSRIRYKIILPYAVLILILAGALIYLTTRLIINQQEVQFQRQVLLAGLRFSDNFALQEQRHLSTLRALRFTDGMAQAIQEGNQEVLEKLTFPTAINQGIDWVTVTDASGRRLLELRRDRTSSQQLDYDFIRGSVEIDWPIVGNVLRGDTVEVEGETSDKFADIIRVDRRLLFMTAASVLTKTSTAQVQNNQEPQVEIVGTVVVGTYLEDFLTQTKARAQADFTIYDHTGQVQLSTFLLGDAPPLQNPGVLYLDPDARLRLGNTNEPVQRKQVRINNRDFDFLYDELRLTTQDPARRDFFSVAIPSDEINSNIADLITTLVLAFAAAILLAFGIGYFSSSRIIAPLDELVNAAEAVAEGDLSKRPRITSSDEIGLLARRFGHMTDSLSKRIQELTLLHRSSEQATSSGLDLDEVILAVIRSAQEALPETDEVFVYLLDEDDAKFVPFILPGETEPARPTIPYSPEGALTRLLLSASTEILPIEDVKKTGPLGWLHEGNRTGIFITSLTSNQGLVGLMLLATHHPEGWSDEFLQEGRRLMHTMANQAAMAINNAQLFEKQEAAYKELQQLDKLKGMFIDIAAHELKTPLGAMLPLVPMLKRNITTDLTDEDIEYIREDLQLLEAAMLRMREITQSIHAVQQAEAGTALLRLTEVDMAASIRKVVADTQIIASVEGQHTIEIAPLADLPKIQADQEKIDLVLTNLVSNAVKFTRANGLIRINAEVKDDYVVVSVQDNGVGIAEEDRERIFDRWQQAKPEHRTHGGMGLGLTIVKYMVELHGGQVYLDSQVGKGSTFYISLPIRQPDRPAAQVPERTRAEEGELAVK